MVRKHMPNTLATARGHLDKTAANQPHPHSEAVSALQRHHTRQQDMEDKKKTKGDKNAPFNFAAVPKSTTIHLDYTGILPEVGSNGTRMFMITCWGRYIHIQPMANLRDEATASAFKEAILFWRGKGIVIDTVRMDNQCSAAVRSMAVTLDVTLGFVPPHDKSPNRAERAIRTAKNHLIAARAGFHKDCPTIYLDKCIQQIEMVLNLIHPYEYDPTISAYEGVFGHTVNLQQHPIAPVGSKVLTWDSPSLRGTWADHGVEAVYLGPAMDHLRSFEVWVPHTSAARITNTVWWFLADKPDCPLLRSDDSLAYPPSRARPNPRDDGSDLVGRNFVEPELGVCVIIGPGPVTTKHLSTRAQTARVRKDQEPAIKAGSHYTLRYRQTDSGEEHFSSVDEILHWISTGPLLSPPSVPVSQNDTNAPITTPPYIPATIRFVPTESQPITPSPLTLPTTQQRASRRDQRVASPSITAARDQSKEQRVASAAQKRVSEGVRGIDRSHLKRNLKPDYHERHAASFLASCFADFSDSIEKQWKNNPDDSRGFPALSGCNEVSSNEGSLSNGNFSDSNEIANKFTFSASSMPIWTNPVPPPAFEDLTVDEDAERFRQLVEDGERQLHMQGEPSMDSSRLLEPMPPSTLPPIFPHGPLNLNSDGTTINYKKSHAGPNHHHWVQADAEEMTRLFNTGTIRPIKYRDIPNNCTVTYVNPVCVEKLHDDGSLKLRTRITIGGDRIIYPYETRAVTAEMEALKILLNCMISEDAQWSTIDLTDFYLGTDLPHPEYIRIQTSLIPPDVIDFFNLNKFIDKQCMYCSVHKTHYGLPQAGALSQQRLFKHLEAHGYHQLPSSPSVFRNKSGSIRFTLVVDDFAVLWTNRLAMDHLVHTLTQLYQVKINWAGSKYLGMNIAIDRKQRHVTLTMPTYIERLLRKVKPDGIKGSNTPAIYNPPNYANPGAQRATVDESAAASEDEKKLLQSVVGTLLYYSRAVDPSISPAVHALGSIQSKPSRNDMQKLDKLLQYVSKHRNMGIRFYASSMILQLMSDASYLCRPKAHSVVGSLAYLGSSYGINGPISCHSKMISCVVASVAEAELAGGFQIAQAAVHFRRILHDLGYPQSPTLLRMDNTVAISIATESINAKRSKSMDMRFFWIIDRIKQGQFSVQHIPGEYNIADHFTKPLPRAKFWQFLNYLVINMDTETPSNQKIKTITIPKRL
jgi:hypothetical protein